MTFEFREGPKSNGKSFLLKINIKWKKLRRPWNPVENAFSLKQAELLSENVYDVTMGKRKKRLKDTKANVEPKCHRMVDSIAILIFVIIFYKSKLV